MISLASLRRFVTRPPARPLARLCFALVAVSLAPDALRALELPTIFSDHMVLQRDQPLPVWGRAAAGAKVAVAFGTQSVEAVADADGRWRATLAPEKASATPSTLRVTSGEKKISFSDVLVGEVWLCSGQSNMALNVRTSRDGDLFTLGGGHPLIRLYQVDVTPSTTPRFSAKTGWAEATPASIGKFSAVGFHFGRTLQSVLGVPVGLVGASVGGTPAIAWTRPSVFEGHPLFQSHLAEWEEGMKTFPERHAAHLLRLAAWKKSRGLAPDAKVNAWEHDSAPQPEPFDPAGTRRPGVLANGMLAPVVPFSIRGAVWYQGEGDAGWAPGQYEERLRLMVHDWREWWGNPSLAFGVVQLASFSKPVAAPAEDAWARLRESQRRFARADPHAGLVAALDVGEANDIHPLDKQTVGQRLARWALADVYKKISLRGGPEPVEAAFADTVRIRFESVGGGLWPFDGGPLEGFTLAGPDGVFHPAKAVLQGKDAVLVSSPAVPAPHTVRYAWARNPRGANLSNRQRHPAAAFELLKPSAPTP